MKDGKGKKKVQFFSDIKSILHDNVYINKVPSYGNTIFYSFGFILITLFLLLAISGTLMAFFTQPWWLTSSLGIYVRSVHMWAAQAFMLFLVLHLFVTFSTSAFRKKKAVWLAGAIMLFIFVVETELGYGLRGDFSTQWRALQGADFWNGNPLGSVLNMLNYSQVFSIHVLIIPLTVLVLIALHYGIVRKRGLSKPYRKGVKYKMVEASHKSLYLRASIVVAVVLILGFLVQSPFVPPVTVQQISQQQPDVFAQTLVQEFNYTSDTATYQNTVDPYTFSTRNVFVIQPYEEFISVHGGKDLIPVFNAENSSVQNQNINGAMDYFSGNGTINLSENANPLIPVMSSLVVMGQSGLYDAKMKADLTGDNPTYEERILSDTGYMDEKADGLGLSLENYGMIKDEAGGGILPPNSWWMAPFNILDNTILANDPNQDRDGGEIVGLVMLILATLPWIPYFNRIPDWLGLYKIFWKTEKKKGKSRKK